MFKKIITEFPKNKNMTTDFKPVSSSKISISELMLPSHTNFSGKIHGGYILQLLDQIAFASASKFSGNYCVTASVDTVNFLKPIDVTIRLNLFAFTKGNINFPFISVTVAIVSETETSFTDDPGKIPTESRVTP